MSETRGRRTQTSKPVVDETEQVVSQLARPVSNAGLLEHGLNTGDDLYVWANRLNATDISDKLRGGFRLVKKDEVASLLDSQGVPAAMYQEDQYGNLTYGVDLVLMRGSRAEQERRVKLALADQLHLVQDASVSEMQSNLDQLLSTTNIKRADRPRVSLDEEHGTQKTIELK